MLRRRLPLRTSGLLLLTHLVWRHSEVTLYTSYTFPYNLIDNGATIVPGITKHLALLTFTALGPGLQFALDVDLVLVGKGGQDAVVYVAPACLRLVVAHHRHVFKHHNYFNIK